MAGSSLLTKMYVDFILGLYLLTLMIKLSIIPFRNMLAKTFIRPQQRLHNFKYLCVYKILEC